MAKNEFSVRGLMVFLSLFVSNIHTGSALHVPKKEVQMMDHCRAEVIANQCYSGLKFRLSNADAFTKISSAEGLVELLETIHHYSRRLSDRAHFLENLKVLIKKRIAELEKQQKPIVKLPCMGKKYSVSDILLILGSWAIAGTCFWYAKEARNQYNGLVKEYKQIGGISGRSLGNNVKNYYYKIDPCKTEYVGNTTIKHFQLTYSDSQKPTVERLFDLLEEQDKKNTHLIAWILAGCGLSFCGFAYNNELTRQENELQAFRVVDQKLQDEKICLQIIN